MSEKSRFLSALAEREPKTVEHLKKLLGENVDTWVIEDLSVDPQWWEQAEEPDTTSCLAAALSYAKRGWYVIPVHGIVNDTCTCSKGSDCRTPGKHPRILQWTEKASTDPRVIRAWWRERPESNVGIVTGQKSGLIVVDVDPGKGGLVSFQGLVAEGKIPDVPFTVRTGSGGFHLYLKYRKSHGKTRTGWRPGVDVRGDGGMVVAPPSVHMKGSYEWWGRA